MQIDHVRSRCAEEHAVEFVFIARADIDLFKDLQKRQDHHFYADVERTAAGVGIADANFPPRISPDDGDGYGILADNDRSWRHGPGRLIEIDQAGVNYSRAIEELVVAGVFDDGASHGKLHRIGGHLAGSDRRGPGDIRRSGRWRWREGRKIDDVDLVVAAIARPAVDHDVVHLPVAQVGGGQGEWLSQAAVVAIGHGSEIGDASLTGAFNGIDLCLDAGAHRRAEATRTRELKGDRAVLRPKGQESVILDRTAERRRHKSGAGHDAGVVLVTVEQAFGEQRSIPGSRSGVGSGLGIGKEGPGAEREAQPKLFFHISKCWGEFEG